jgi:cell division protein FtsA
LEGMMEFAEEILGMPVRLGVPVGVKGISQLVQGPQFATGVGLVQFGAKALTQARDRSVGTSESVRLVRPRMVEDEVSPAEDIPKRKPGRFWNWLRAAF